MATPTQIRRRGRYSLILGTLVAALMVAAVAYADTIITEDLVTSGNATATRSGGGTANVYITQQGPACDANGDRINVTDNQAWASIASPGYVNITGCGEANAQTIGYSIDNTAPLGGVVTISGSEHVDDPQIVTGPNSNFNVTVVPRAPSSLASLSKTAASVSLSWTLSADDSDLSNYQLERGSNISGPFTILDNPAKGVTSYTDSGLDASTQYCYRLASRFQAGGGVGTLLSAYAGPLCVTTNSSTPSDTTPPSVSTFALRAGSDSGSSNSDRITKASTLTYDLVFSEPVTGVAASDFSTSGTATGCTAENVTGSGTTYTVDLTGCSEGTVTLTFAANGASDTASNTGPTSEASAAAVTIDRTAPVVASKLDVVVYTMSAPTTVNFTNPSATDANPASPTVTCSPASGTSFAQGETIVTCSAEDTAGNTGQNTFKVIVNVLAVTFLKPVDAAPTMNIAKLGRVIPVKIVLTLNGTPVAYPSALPIAVAGASGTSCTVAATTDSVEEYVTGGSNDGSLFRWDGTGSYWIYNFDTSAFNLKVNNCYRISVTYGGHLAGYFFLQTTK